MPDLLSRYIKSHHTTEDFGVLSVLGEDIQNKRVVKLLIRFNSNNFNATAAARAMNKNFGDNHTAQWLKYEGEDRVLITLSLPTPITDYRTFFDFLAPRLANDIEFEQRRGIERT